MQTFCALKKVSDSPILNPAVHTDHVFTQDELDD